MKESSWNDCLEESAVKITPDYERAKSLIETSKERISLIKEINRQNANFVFEDYYNSILKLLQALTLKNGYKVINHICLGFYLRDFLRREDLFVVFDDLRYKRNSLTYYGKKMDFEVAKETILKCKNLFNELNDMIRFQ